MSDDALKLLFFVQGNTCFLLNQGTQSIAELEFDHSSFGLEDGYVVGSDYGRFRVRDFAPGTFFKLYEMTREEIIYSPRGAWFELSIHCGKMADGMDIGACVLKSVDKYGGYVPPGNFVDIMIQRLSGHSS